MRRRRRRRPAPTVTQTVAPETESAQTPPEGATGPTTAEETAPTKPLPTDTGGATAVQGRYIMRVTQSELPLLEEGEELTWGAITRCEPECEVELRRENENGGFKTIEMEADGNSRYFFEGPSTTDRCLGEEPARERTSLSVIKQRDEGGIPLATVIEGFVRSTLQCGDRTEVLRLRGRLQE